MSNKAIIYHTEGCVKCKITSQRLNMETEMILVDAKNDSDKLIIDNFRKKGYKSFPVVQVYHNEDLVDEWNDFNINKIKYWNDKNK